MIERPLHPFFELPDHDRATWIARFCDQPRSTTTLYGVSFPALPPKESAYSWLVYQHRRHTGIKGAREKLSTSVAHLLRNPPPDSEFSNRYQVLGTLLRVAGRCGVDVNATLREWIRFNAFRSAEYRLDSDRISLRETIWSVLIAGGQTENLELELERDLADPDLADCHQLCFVELGKLAPAKAITFVPKTVHWPRDSWRGTMRSFFATRGAVPLLDSSLRSAWEACLGQCYFRHEIFKYLKPPYAPQYSGVQGDELTRILEEVGITLRGPEGGVFHLTAGEPPSLLAVNVSVYMVAYDRALFADLAGLWSSGSTIAELDN